MNYSQRLAERAKLDSQSHEYYNELADKCLKKVIDGFNDGSTYVQCEYFFYK